MLMPLITLLVSAQVYCHPNMQEWKANKTEVNAPAIALAYMNPQNNQIHLGPYACRHTRTPTPQGAWILTHELAHLHQSQAGEDFSPQNRTHLEQEADTYAQAHYRQTLRTLCRQRPNCLAQIQPVTLTP